LVQQVNSGHAPAKRCAGDAHERELEANFAATVRTDYAAAAHPVQKYNDAWVEAVWKAIAVECLLFVVCY
jgi:hypothetical protein